MERERLFRDLFGEEVDPRRKMHNTRVRLAFRTHVIHIHIPIYIRVCVCVCVSVCTKKEMERERLFRDLF